MCGERARLDHIAEVGCSVKFGCTAGSERIAEVGCSVELDCTAEFDRTEMVDRIVEIDRSVAGWLRHRLGVRKHRRT